MYVLLVGSKQQIHYTCTTTKAPNQRNYLATNALTCNSNLIRNVETAHITYIHIW